MAAASQIWQVPYASNPEVRHYPSSRNRRVFQVCRMWPWMLDITKSSKTFASQNVNIPYFEHFIYATSDIFGIPCSPIFTRPSMGNHLYSVSQRSTSSAISITSTLTSQPRTTTSNCPSPNPDSPTATTRLRRRWL